MYTINNFKATARGQTILEIIIALALIILFLSGIIVVQLLSIRNVKFAQSKSIATKLAREQIERARVVRDSAGIDALLPCQSNCFINDQLTPVAISPTGIFVHSLTIQSASASDCPLPAVTITPAPISYVATVLVSWSQGEINITPAPELSISSCITDWR